MDDFVELHFQMDCLDPLVFARVFATENLALGQETYAPYRWDHSGIEAVDGLNETIWQPSCSCAADVATPFKFCQCVNILNTISQEALCNYV